MVRLNPQCISAFVRHSIDLDCKSNREAYVFARKLLVSKSYLSSSRLDSAYRMRIWAQSDGIEVAFGRNDYGQTQFTSSLPDVHAQKLVSLLNPPTIFISFFEDHISARISTVIEHTNGKIALIILLQITDTILEFIANHCSRIKIVKCFPSFLADERIPALNLDCLQISCFRSMDDFKSVMRHQTKKLQVNYIHRNAASFKELPDMDDFKSLPMSQSVTTLQVAIAFDNEQKMILLIARLKKMFPCVETLELCIEKSEYSIGQFRPKQMTDALLEDYAMLQRIKQHYRGKWQHLEINFERDFWFAYDAGLDGIWVSEIMKQDQFKSANFEYYNPEANYLAMWHSIALHEREKSYLLKFHVYAGIEIVSSSSDDYSGSDGEE